MRLQPDLLDRSRDVLRVFLLARLPQALEQNVEHLLAYRLWRRFRRQGFFQLLGLRNPRFFCRAARRFSCRGGRPGALGIYTFAGFAPAGLVYSRRGPKFFEVETRERPRRRGNRRIIAGSFVPITVRRDKASPWRLGESVTAGHEKGSHAYHAEETATYQLQIEKTRLTRPAAASTLPGLVAFLRLINNIHSTFAAHQLIVAVPRTQGFQGVTNFHRTGSKKQPAILAGSMQALGAMPYSRLAINLKTNGSCEGCPPGRGALLRPNLRAHKTFSPGRGPRFPRVHRACRKKGSA
jgi:hypothetical protein